MYDRISTRRQKERGYSQGAQFKDTHDYTESLGADVVARWSDVESGADWNLSGLIAMLKAAREREVDVIVCYDPDCFARNMTKQLVIEEELRRHGVALQFARFKLEDTAEGRLVKNQLSAFAEYEREKILMRTTRGKREKAERGEVIGYGRPPYGYLYVRNALDKVVGLIPDETRAPTVRRILALLLRQSAHDVAAVLNGERLPAPTGRRWGASTVQRVARSFVYIGTVPVGLGSNPGRIDPDAEGSYIRVPVPALVDRPTWEAAQRAMLNRRSARRGRIPKESDPCVLRGMLTCGHCGRTLATVTAPGVRYYQCLQSQPRTVRIYGWKERCCLRFVSARQIEAYTWQVVTDALLDRDRLTEGLAAARSEHDEADRQRRERLDIIDREVKAQLEKIVDKLLDAERGTEVEATLKRRAREIEDTIGRHKAERASLEAMTSAGLSEEDALTLDAFADEVRRGIAAASPQRQRQTFALLQARGKVSQDSAGVTLGRVHRYNVAWEARIPLTNSAPRFLNLRIAM